VQLKIETRLAGSIGQSLDAAVIEEATTIEDHLLDALRLSCFGNSLADFLGCRDVAALLDLQGQRRMLVSERCTLRRGRSGVPASLARMRA